MNGHEQGGGAQDPQRTVLVPQPGGRPRQGAPAAGPQAAHPAHPAQPAAPQRAVAPPDLSGLGANPLVAAAKPVLNLVLPLRMMTHAEVEPLRIRLCECMAAFERQARAASIDLQAIKIGHYALCTLLDETISATPWGGNGVWGRQSLLITFHREAAGGEQFFALVQQLSQDPASHLATLELMYLCLALGLEGRYRVVEGGLRQLEDLRGRLFQLIVRQRGAAERDLSPHWRGAAVPARQPARLVRLWVAGAGVLGLLGLAHVGMSYSLSGKSSPVYEALVAYRPPALQQAAPAALAAPPPAAAAGAPRLAGFLAPEIAQGLVTVQDLPDRSIISLNTQGMFASGSADPSPASLALIGRIGAALRTVPGAVTVVGHTDGRAGFSTRYPSNWDLSVGRAAQVAALLAQQAGPASRYKAEGRGAAERIAPDDTEQNRARNRRVVITLLAPRAAAATGIQ